MDVLRVDEWTITEISQVVLEVVREMVSLPRGAIVKLDVHYMMSVLVGDIDYSDHVER